MKVASESRWRATPTEKRLYGGGTVTRFYAMPTESAKTWFLVTVFGATPSRRMLAAKWLANDLASRGVVNEQGLTIGRPMGGTSGEKEYIMTGEDWQQFCSWLNDMWGAR